MSTAQLFGDRPPLLSNHAETATKSSAQAFGLPFLIGAALLVVVLYAAFDHGAAALSSATRIEVAVAAIAIVGVTGWLGTSRLRFSVSAGPTVGILLLAAFAAWCGVTVIWSVAADQTWIELNRAITYVLVLCLAIAVGASLGRAAELVTGGFLAIALAVSVYALGQKLLPGLHISGVFDLNQAGGLPRLQEPFGYWNALALFAVLAVPIALAETLNATRPPGRRLAAACGLELLLLTVALTLSRGGLLALAAALLVMILVGGDSLRALLWTGVTIIATLPPLVFGLTSHALTTEGVSLSSREGAGAILAGLLIASLIALLFAGRAILRQEPRLRLSPARAERLRRPALAMVAATAVCAVLALVLTGAATHAWNSFTSTRTASNVSPNRLLSADSENRWVWWKEAASAFGDRPVAGWGAGSFGVVHLRYRQNTLPVQQPHSVPLQFLAETGIVGAVLALGALVLLFLAAARSATARSLSPGERLLRVGLFAAAVAYAVHSLYDWDWNIPGLTLPALLFLGVLIGAGHGRARAPGAAASRPLWLAALTAWLCIFAVSATLPGLAASKADAALVAAGSSSGRSLHSAEATARLASLLDPLSDAGLKAQTAIALRRGQLLRARNDLQRAVARSPSDGAAWNELAQVDGILQDRAGLRAAAARVVALDPRGQIAQAIRRAGLAG